MDNCVQLSSTDKEELNWWKEQASLWNARSLLPPANWIKLTTDASNWGWGAVCKEVTTGGPWSQLECYAVEK